jgi:hypothetical protein
MSLAPLLLNADGLMQQLVRNARPHTKQNHGPGKEQSLGTACSA